jgi:hypothetical protein
VKAGSDRGEVAEIWRVFAGGFAGMAGAILYHLEIAILLRIRGGRG